MPVSNTSRGLSKASRLNPIDDLRYEYQMRHMQQRFKLPIFVGLCALAYGLPGWAADLPIGVVEPQKVLDGSKAGRKIKDALADYVNTRQRLIESEEQDIKALEEDLVKQGAALGPEAKQEKEEVIRRKLVTYQRHVRELEGEVQTKKRELLSDFTKKVEQVVREIAEQEKITLVMEKGDAGLGALIMYSEPSIDLTDRVIKAFEGKGARRAPDPPPRSQPQSYTPPSPPANTPAPRGAWRPWVH